MPESNGAIAHAETPLRVLFDGGCPLCRREIAHYRQLTPRRPVQWIDINADPGACEAMGIPMETAMARFHVLEGRRIHTGAEAFVLLWSALPGWQRLATLVRRLHLVPLMERGWPNVYGTSASIRWTNEMTCASGRTCPSCNATPAR